MYLRVIKYFMRKGGICKLLSILLFSVGLKFLEWIRVVQSVADFIVK